jgi:hypothetical protein
MKSLICIMVAIISVTSFGSMRRIEETKPFHLLQSDTSNSEYLNFIERKIDSLRTAECAEPFVNYVKIIKTYDLKDMPCIKIFIAESGRVVQGMMEVTDVYERFLFNTCDSTLYPFGGGWVRFSKFIKAYIPGLYKSNDTTTIRDLINLYLNIQEQDFDYYIVTSKEDLLNIWEDNIRKLPGLYRRSSKKQLNNEAKEISRTLFKIDIWQRDNYKEIQLKTWSNKKGAIEWWQFYLSTNVFQVRAHTIRYFEVGAYYNPR